MVNTSKIFITGEGTGELVNVIVTNAGITRRPGLVPVDSEKFTMDEIIFGFSVSIGKTRYCVLLDGTIEAYSDLWKSKITTPGGKFLFIKKKDEILLAGVKREGIIRIERFDPNVYTDTSADGSPLSFTHVVTPEPPCNEGNTTGARLFRAHFSLLDTQAMRIDTGTGLSPIPFRRIGRMELDTPPAPFTGNVQVRAIGWRKPSNSPLWRIEQDDPLPFTLVSATTEWRDAE